MPLPFDATLKDLVPCYLHDYQVQLGLDDYAPLTPLNVDLSTVTAATDIVLGVGNPPEQVVDINFQSGPDDDLDARVLLYSSLLYSRYRVPVHSLVVLLRPSADSRKLMGKVRYQGRPRKCKMDFTYEILRMWRQPVDRFLKGGLGTLPLAPLCRLPSKMKVSEALDPVIRQVIERLEQEASSGDRAKLLTATYVLTGMRTSRSIADLLFRGVSTMIESTTYQGILNDGGVKALQQTILRQGRHRFGPITAEVRSQILAINKLTRLERLTERVLEASTWVELLETK